MKEIKTAWLIRLQVIMGLIIGIILGIVYSVGGLLVDTLVTFELLSAEYWGTPGLSYGTFLAFGALIGMPFIFAAFGLVLGLVEAFLYEFLIKRIGVLRANL